MDRIGNQLNVFLSTISTHGRASNVNMSIYVGAVVPHFQAKVKNRDINSRRNQIHNPRWKKKREIEPRMNTSLDELLIRRLTERDVVEGNFSQLFGKASVLDKQDSKTGDSLTNLKNELRNKEKEMANLRDILQVKNKDTERLNNEIVSLNIENNLLQEQLDKTTKEYNALVERWLAKAQKEAEQMNASL